MFSTRTAHSADSFILQSFRFVRFTEIGGNSSALFLLTIPNLRDDPWVVFSQGYVAPQWPHFGFAHVWHRIEYSLRLPSGLARELNAVFFGFQTKQKSHCWQSLQYLQKGLRV
jgi:hypothetical protein